MKFKTFYCLFIVQFFMYCGFLIHNQSLLWMVVYGLFAPFIFMSWCVEGFPIDTFHHIFYCGAFTN